MIRALGDGYELDDDPERVDVTEVHRYLSEESYWAAGRPYELAEAIIRAASRVVGLYHEGRQVGFCRAITATGLPAVYLADVYVLEEHRGRGLGKQLVEEMIERGPYADRPWLLHTHDAHDLYRQFGFAEPGPRLMERPGPRRF